MEAALLTPIFVFLVFAIIEGGMYSYSHLAVQDSAVAAARTGSVARDATDADGRILEAIREHAGIVRRASIERIVVYRASDYDADPPPACLTGPIHILPGNDCSTFGPADLDADPTTLPCGWCHDDREAGDLLGVWIKFEYESITGFSPNWTFTDREIMTIEPDL